MAGENRDPKELLREVTDQLKGWLAIDDFSVSSASVSYEYHNEVLPYSPDGVVRRDNTGTVALKFEVTVTDERRYKEHMDRVAEAYRK